MKHVYDLGRRSFVKYKRDSQSGSTKLLRITGDITVTLDLDHPEVKRMIQRACENKSHRAIEMGGAITFVAANVETEVVP